MTKPLSGIRIADFTVHAAGPFCTHLLAQLGAECIKIESTQRPDIFRKPHALYGRLEPSKFDQVSSGKLSVRLNLKHPQGVELARSLVSLSDVAVENFRAGVMARLGLGWHDLLQVKSDLVMVSVSSCGQISPDSAFSGYAPLFGAWGGLGTMSGYQDGPPLEMRHVLDHAAGLQGMLAVLAGLQGRASTGCGSYYDVAARDIACASIGEFLLEAASGSDPVRWGNAHPGMAPHGVYPVKGQDRWLTIAVRSDDEWRALCDVMDRHDLVNDPRFATAQARLANRVAADDVVAAWTVHQDSALATRSLQAALIAAHESWSAQDIAMDPHLRARGTIVDFNSPDGQRVVVQSPIRFSESDTGVEHGMPELGGHEDYVFGTLLNLSRSERTELEEAGAIC